MWLTAVDEDPSRQEIHYFLIFPPGFYLDNKILGDHTAEMAPFWRDMKQDHPIISDLYCTAHYIYWRIALIGVEQVKKYRVFIVHDEYD